MLPSTGIHLLLETESLSLDTAILSSPRALMFSFTRTIRSSNELRRDEIMKVVSPSRSGHLMVWSRTMIAALLSPVVFENFAVGLVRADAAKFSTAPTTRRSGHLDGREIAGTENFMAAPFQSLDQAKHLLFAG